MDKLNILWTSDNENTAINMIHMYTTTAKKNGFFEDITVIIWGGSNELIKKSPKVREAIVDMINKGINVKACLSCAKNMGTEKIIESLGVKLEYMGEPLTKIIKDNNEYLITI